MIRAAGDERPLDNLHDTQPDLLGARGHVGRREDLVLRLCGRWREPLQRWL